MSELSIGLCVDCVFAYTANFVDLVEVIFVIVNINIIAFIFKLYLSIINFIRLMDELNTLPISLIHGNEEATMRGV